ncbi:hypothetical protein [Candidatus Protochlamydia phocaeensis]|uniref:hypothetical protein n=1 Tax=Candidatus Protochlamydia phocaeensis TaxID=1414722 RepID=UPI000838E1A3|nr:hypothetical protein [Candidatus Protochlamydia phocaeensis]
MNILISQYQQFTNVFTNAMRNRTYIRSDTSAYLESHTKFSNFKTKQITAICRECIDYFSNHSPQPLGSRITLLTQLEGALHAFSQRIQSSIENRWWYPLLHFFGYRAQAPKDVRDLLALAHRKQADLQGQAQGLDRPILPSALPSPSSLERQEVLCPSLPEKELDDLSTVNDSSPSGFSHQEQLCEQRLHAFREVFKPLEDPACLSEGQLSAMRDMLKSMSTEELKAAFEKDPNCFYLQVDQWQFNRPLTALGALLHLMPADKLPAFYHLCLARKEFYLSIANLIFLSFHDSHANLIPHLQHLFQLMSASDLLDFTTQLASHRNWRFKPSLLTVIPSFLSEESRQLFYEQLVQEPDAAAYFIEAIHEKYPQEAAKVLHLFLLKAALFPSAENTFGQLVQDLSVEQRAVIAHFLFPLLNAQSWSRLINLCQSFQPSFSFLEKVLSLVQEPSALSLILIPEALADKWFCFGILRIILSHPSPVIRESACLIYLQSPLCQVHGFMAFFEEMHLRSLKDPVIDAPVIDQLIPHLNPLQLLLLKSMYFNRNQTLPTSLQMGLEKTSLSMKDYLALAAGQKNLPNEDLSTLKPMLYNWIESHLRDKNWDDLIKSLETQELALLLDIMPKHARFAIPALIWRQCTSLENVELPQVREGLRLFLENASDQAIQQIHSYFSDAFRFQSRWYPLLTPRQRMLTLSYWLNKDAEEFSTGIDAILRHYPENQVILLEIVCFCESQFEEVKQQFYPRIAELFYLPPLIESAYENHSQEAQAFVKNLFKYVTDLQASSLEKISLLQENETEELLESCQNHPKLACKLIFTTNWQTRARLQEHLERCLKKAASSCLAESEFSLAVKTGLLTRQAHANPYIFIEALGTMNIDSKSHPLLKVVFRQIVSYFDDKKLDIAFSPFEAANLHLLLQTLTERYHSDCLSRILESLPANQMAHFLCCMPFSAMQNQSRAIRFWPSSQVIKLFSHLRPDLQGLLFKHMTILGNCNMDFLGQIVSLYKGAEAPLLKVFLDQTDNSSDIQRLIPILYFSDFFQLRLLKDNFKKALKELPSPLACANGSPKAILDADLSLPSSPLKEDPANIIRKLDQLDRFSGHPVVNFAHIESLVASIKQGPVEQAKWAIASFSPYQLVVAWHFMDKHLKAYASEIHREETLALCHQFPVERLLLAQIEPVDYPAFAESLTTEQRQSLFGIQDLSLESIKSNKDKITPAGICVAFCLSKEKDAWKPVLINLSTAQLLALYEFLNAEQKESLIPHLTSEKLLALLNLSSVRSADDLPFLTQTLLKQLFGKKQGSFPAKNLLWSNETELTGQLLRLSYHLNSYQEPTLRGMQAKDKDELKLNLEQNINKISVLPHTHSFLHPLLNKSAQEWNWQESLIAKLGFEILVNMEKKGKPSPSEVKSSEITPSGLDFSEMMAYAHLNQIHQKLQLGLNALKEVKEFAPFALALKELIGNLHQILEDNHLMEQAHEEVNYLPQLNQDIYAYYAHE